jgi:hypothetical protein
MVYFFFPDTDSIVFVHPEDLNVLPISPHLGRLTDEYPDHRILEWVSGGAKQYGLKLAKIGAAEEVFEYLLKIRGMTLNHDVMENQGLRYDTFKDSVLNFVNGIVVPIPAYYPMFLRPSFRHGTVISTPLTKVYKPFVGKGVIRPSDFTVLNFGHISSK